MNKDTACEHCGTKKVEVISPISGNKLLAYNCKCLDEIEKQKAEDEIKRLNEQKRNKIFSNAKLPKRYLKLNFDNIQKNPNVLKAIDYIKDFKPDTDYSISLIGDVGTGKTVILTCICKYLLENKKSALFIDFSRLLDRVMATYSPNSKETEQDIYDWLLSYDFIAFDDLGREKYTDKRLEIAFKIFNDLYNNEKNIAFSSNAEMLDKLKAIPDFNAIIDRLRQTCKYNLQFKGASLR